MTVTVGIDSNYYIHRAFHVAATTRNIEHLKKNTLTLFLQLICADLVKLRATHAVTCFDSPGCFRYDIYKDYKSGRRKSKTTDVRLRDGSTITVEATPGSFVKPALEVVRLAGITSSYVPGLESDDLLGGLAHSDLGRVIISTRDKDLAVLVNDQVSIYWPREEQHVKVPEVLKEWGVEPRQIRDYLCLLGDNSDSIPGVPGFGPVTARRLLKEHGSIAAALKSKEWRSRLLEHKDTLVIAKKLVSLNTETRFRLKDLAIKDMNQELLTHIWEAPKSLKDLGEARKMSKMRGLFG